MADNALDPNNKRMHQARAEQWKQSAEEIQEQINSDNMQGEFKKTFVNGEKSEIQEAKSDEIDKYFKKESLENAGISNTIELARKSKNYRVEPMPKKQFRTIVNSFERHGGTMKFDKETERYLDSKHVEGITLNKDIILLRQNPNRAAVFEEIIHSAQYRDGKMDGSQLSRLKCEIEAQEKLLKYQKEYRLTAHEVEQTKKL